jgi:hypothetical protein
MRTLRLILAALSIVFIAGDFSDGNQRDTPGAIVLFSVLLNIALIVDVFLGSRTLTRVVYTGMSAYIGVLVIPHMLRAGGMNAMTLGLAVLLAAPYVTVAIYSWRSTVSQNTPPPDKPSPGE